uniref:Uncharacterized protein n=1 Tax=Cacopsylla melanoneura TaxID=428564 RepID=A0A8D8YVW3_9HEMI
MSCSIYWLPFLSRDSPPKGTSDGNEKRESWRNKGGEKCRNVAATRCTVRARTRRIVTAVSRTWNVFNRSKTTERKKDCPGSNVNRNAICTEIVTWCAKPRPLSLTPRLRLKIVLTVLWTDSIIPTTSCLSISFQVVSR